MSPSSATTAVGDTLINGLETYVVLEQVGFGTKSIVYRVICKSGRLRNRQLALKRFSSTSMQPHFNTSYSIHTALHHPNIISMFSAFCTPLESFHVLEFCSIGSLSAFLLSRSPPSLLEAELRGVTKSLIEALMYLKKERVIHCNITLSNLFLTHDYVVKLSGFDHAIRLRAIDSSASTDTITSRCSCNLQDLAPEIAAGASFSFAADVWSVGCVILASLSGSLPLDVSTIPRKIFTRLPSGYSLSGDLSSELRNLIQNILQARPEDRLSLSNILSHPFLDSDLGIQSLRPNLNNVSITENAWRKEKRNQPIKLAPFPAKPVKVRRPTRHSSIYPLPAPSTTRSALRDLVNTDLRNLLCDEITASSKSPIVTGPTRRIVSDPIPRSTSAMAAELNVPSTPRSLLVPHFSSSLIKVQDEEDTRLSSSTPNTPLLVTDHGGSAEITDTPQQQTSGQNFAVRPYISQDDKFDCHDVHLGMSMPLNDLSVGTTRPVQFDTSGLRSQTHKVIYGQLTVLPSHALLVDFRESQRRKGFKGDEVMLIDKNGTMISVYSAPHLSTPCCLVEPIEQFALAKLPSAYWKQYNDAGCLVNQIKQRTPKLVVYTVAAKCTLMANIPQGDVELTFHSPSSAKSRGQQQGRPPYMRIRFSRQNQLMELSQHVTGIQGGEWTKKSLSSTFSPPYVSTDNWTTLNNTERGAIQQLVHFVRTCEAVEGLLVLDELPMLQSINQPQADTKVKSSPPQYKNQTSKICIAYSTPLAATSMSSVKVARRPPKFATGSAASSWSVPGGNESNDHSKPLDGSIGNNVAADSVRSTLDPLDPAEWFIEEFTRENRGMQTRFLPSVGWCIRYGSKVSQGGRYRIMFLDGIALEIDVDEDWAELRSGTRSPTRRRIRDCSSDKKIGERMKVFEEFISLFDDSRDEKR